MSIVPESVKAKERWRMKLGKEVKEYDLQSWSSSWWAWEPRHPDRSWERPRGM